jgi:hypothetical protein
LMLWWVWVHSTMGVNLGLFHPLRLWSSAGSLCKGLSHHSLEAYHDSVVDEPQTNKVMLGFTMVVYPTKDKSYRQG